jgi:hypothetical protein
MPLFDLTQHPIGCTEKIEFASVPFTLAPAVAELEFRGGLFQPNWTIGLEERTIARSSDTPDPNGVRRKFPLCFSSTGPEQTTLVLGVLPRAEALPTTGREKKRTKARE